MGAVIKRKSIDRKELLVQKKKQSQQAIEASNVMVGRVKQTLTSAENAINQSNQLTVQEQQVTITINQLVAELKYDETSLSCIEQALDKKILPNNAKIYASISFAIFEKYQVPPLSEIKQVNEIVDKLASWFYWGKSYISRNGPFAEGKSIAPKAFLHNLLPGKHKFFQPEPRHKAQDAQKKSIEEATEGALRSAGIPLKPTV